MVSNTVYWANLSGLPDELMAPKPLLKDLADSQAEHKGSNWVACPAITARHKNTFMTTFPYDLVVDFEKQYASDPLASPRVGLYKNSFAFNWNINRIFFSDKPQTMEVTPAFLHETSYSQYGHAPSGAFDINKWFRPSSPTFQLWTGKSQFIAREAEAHLYFNFPNDNKVTLTQFSMSLRLREILEFCVTYKNHVPRQPLLSIYGKFEQMGMRKETLKEIKQNLYL